MHAIATRGVGITGRLELFVLQEQLDHPLGVVATGLQRLRTKLPVAAGDLHEFLHRRTIIVCHTGNRR